MQFFYFFATFFEQISRSGNPRNMGSHRSLQQSMDEVKNPNVEDPSVLSLDEIARKEMQLH